MNHRIAHSAWMAGSVVAALLMLGFVTAGDAVSAAGPRSDPDAMRLLGRAQDAARRTPYEGVQLVVSWSRSGAGVTSLVDVTHVPRWGTEQRVQPTTADPGGSSFEADDDPPPTSGGLIGYAPKMLDLLGKNYAIVNNGTESVAGRNVLVVAAKRADGSTAGQFYIDSQTGMMLRRELLDRQGRVVDLQEFTEFKLTNAVPVRSFAATATAETPWAHELADAEIGTLRHVGWPIDSRLPGGLSLCDARQRSDHDPVVHLGYSDGLSMVSVFVQRGVLDPKSLRGWQVSTRGGHRVYIRDSVQQQVIWAGRGYVYTVLADATPETVDRAVAALPYGEPGFWSRLKRGMNRLASWANPF